MDILIHLSSQERLTEENRHEIEQVLQSEFETTIVKSEFRQSKVTQDRMILLIEVENYTQPEYEDFLEAIEDEFNIKIVILSIE